MRTESETIVTHLNRRREASKRMQAICTWGCIDPWTCPHKGEAMRIDPEATWQNLLHLRANGTPGIFQVAELSAVAELGDDARRDALEQFYFQTGTQPNATVTTIQPRTRRNTSKQAA